MKAKYRFEPALALPFMPAQRGWYTASTLP